MEISEKQPKFSENEPLLVFVGILDEDSYDPSENGEQPVRLNHLQCVPLKCGQ